MAFLFSIWATIFIFKIPEPGKCLVKQAVFNVEKKRYLANHIIATKQVDNELDCNMYCVADGSCVSVNFKTSGIGKGRCELNDKTLKEISDADRDTKNPEFNHLYIIFKKPTESPMTQESSTNASLILSCKELLDRNRSLTSGVYKLNHKNSTEEYPVYCHMTEIHGCGGGGWTLVMKIDGNKDDFDYDSSYWTNKEVFTVNDGLEGLTEKQTKLASYWNTPFNKLCLGMKVNNIKNWIVGDHQASSLLNQIADGSFRETSAGRDQWKSLIDGSSLQAYCNKEGFNYEKKFDYGDYVKTRIGLVANEQNECDSPDSCIGFGTSVKGCGLTLTTTCGNLVVCEQYHNVDNRDTAAFGFILVQ